MSKENKKLGMGLSALLSANNRNKSTINNIKKIDISKISPNKKQPRKNFDSKEMQQLSNSIKNQGLIQPIVVREISSDSFEIIAGERRWRACQIAGLHSLNCVIMSIDEENVYELALIENIQRENLNAVEEARAYKAILENKHSDYDNLSSVVGKSKSHVSNMIRLLELEEEVLDFIVSGKLSMGHARALIGVPNALILAKEIIAKKLSVRQVEKNTSNFKKKKNKKIFKDPNIVDLESELSEKIGLKTSIHFNEEGSSGSLTLYYSDLDQLDDLMKRLKK